MESMFLFEVVVEKVKSLVENQEMYIKAEFADIFSLDIKEPKQLDIKIPEPPPPPPVVAAKNKKGKAKPPKKKKGKKGKDALPPPPPAEPQIQSGQSCLFPSNVDFLVENMKTHPLVVSLWNKDKMLVYIGSTRIQWDPSFFDFLKKLSMCNDQIQVSNTVKGDHNIFDEETSKLMATVTFQVKLTHLRDKIMTQFKIVPDFGTLEADTKKILYRGCDTASSFMCNVKTKATGSECVQSTFVEKRDEIGTVAPIHYADYRNVPATNISFGENLYGCGINANCPEMISKLPNKAVDLNYMAEYINKMIRSCNDSLRLLVPRPEIQPRFRAADLQNRCHCNDDKIKWPDSELAKRMKNFVEYKPPCPICSYKPAPDEIDLDKLKGPCGKTDCHVAKGLREYLCQMVGEDKRCDKNDNERVHNPHETEEGNEICKSILNRWLHDRPDTEICNNPSPLASTGQSESNDCVGTRQLSSHSSDDECRCLGGHCDNNIYNKSKNNTTIANICMTKQFCIGGCKTTDDQSTECATSSSNSCCQAGDEGVTIKIDDIGGPCGTKKFCSMADKVKQFLADQVENPRLKSGSEDPCFCDCDCKFDWKTKTTYCFVCGGYEFLGDDLKDLPPYAIPNPPCPIYHKTYEVSNLTVPEIALPPPSVEPTSKSKSVPKNDAASQPTVKNTSKESKMNTPAMRRSGGASLAGFSLAGTIDKNHKDGTKESIRNIKKSEKKKRGKFTCNYGFKGIPPQIGHDRCFIPHPHVPKHMGWLWTAEDVPGMKYRAGWKPGAAHKYIVNLYRSIRNPEEVNIKRLRSKGKKIEKKQSQVRPTLVVRKKDGEYKVTLRRLNDFMQPRSYSIPPYTHEKPLEFTVGRNEEENEKRKRRRSELEKIRRRRIAKVEETYKKMCEKICLSAFYQALGMSVPDDNLASNLCDDFELCPDQSYATSESDCVDWLLEFTPPIVRSGPDANKPHVDNSVGAQYDYLDFKVKVEARFGHPVPRYFKGPDGKMVCSDLGGFRDPEGKWVEINVDGYISSDDRWVPNSFIGPDGKIESSEVGQFIGPDGNILVIGVDGYVDENGKWDYYPPKPRPKRSRHEDLSPSEWSCFGTATPEFLAELGIVGHGQDKINLVKRLKQAIAAGADIKIPEPSKVPRSGRKPTEGRRPVDLSECYKCKHLLASDKGIIAVDDKGNKTYFSIEFKNNRPKYRLQTLEYLGYNICSYHVPCFSSFIGCEEFQRLIREKLVHSLD